MYWHPLVMNILYMSLAQWQFNFHTLAKHLSLSHIYSGFCSYVFCGHGHIREMFFFLHTRCCLSWKMTTVFLKLKNNQSHNVCRLCFTLIKCFPFNYRISINQSVSNWLNWNAVICYSWLVIRVSGRNIIIFRMFSFGSHSYCDLRFIPWPQGCMGLFSYIILIRISTMPFNNMTES